MAGLGSGKRTKLDEVAMARNWKTVRVRAGVYSQIIRLMREGESRGDVVLLAMRELDKARG